MNSDYQVPDHLTIEYLAREGSGVVQAWPDDVRLAPLDRAAQQEAVRLAESVHVTLGRSLPG